MTLNLKFRESLEDENLKLMEMVRQRETTIKKLESRTRNALEISIKADDGMLFQIVMLQAIFSAIKANSQKMEKLQKENEALQKSQSLASRTEKMANQE